MRRQFLTSLLALGFGCAMAPAQNAEVTYWLDPARKQTGKATGTIQEETAARIVIKTGFTEVKKTIAARDVIDVNYSVDKAKSALTRAAAAERGKDLAQALAAYREALPLAIGAPLARRHVEFKVALLTSELTTDDPQKRAAAAGLLEAFRKNHPDAWQQGACLRALAVLHDDPAKIAETHDALAALPGTTAAEKAEAALAAIRALMQGRQFAAAQQRLEPIVKADPDAFDASLLLILCRGKSDLGGAVKELETLLSASKDPRRTAVAHNILGDCYRLHDRPKDALYEYLWVDLVYHSDRPELLRAVDQLARLFTQLKQPERAKEYADKLARLRKE